jgi:hypothetical protein
MSVVAYFFSSSYLLEDFPNWLIIVRIPFGFWMEVWVPWRSVKKFWEKG